MSDKNSSKSFSDKSNEFFGAIVFGIIVIAIVLYIIYKLIVEIIIPVLIVVFLVAVAFVLAVVLVRVLAHLFAYLTLENRCRRKLATLSEKVSQLDAYVSTAEERISDWPSQRRHAVEAELQQLATKREKMNDQIQNTATALADHLADKLDGINKSRTKILRKIDRGGSEKLSRKLEKREGEASLLEAEIERLRTEYYIEPDPAFERKVRKYPTLSKFDRFVASRFNRSQYP
jgi:hypothetical protein